MGDRRPGGRGCGQGQGDGRGHQHPQRHLLLSSKLSVVNLLITHMLLCNTECNRVSFVINDVSADHRQLSPAPGGVEQCGGEAGAGPGGAGGPPGRPPRPAHHLGQPHGRRQRVRGLVLVFFLPIVMQFFVLHNKGEKIHCSPRAVLKLGSVY